MIFRVEFCYLERGRRFVDRHRTRVDEFAQQSYGNTSGSCSHIANKRSCTNVTNFLERRFDQQFCLRPRNQNIRRHTKLASVKVLNTRDVLQRLAGSTPFDEFTQSNERIFVRFILSMTNQKRPILAENERQQKPRLASRLRHTCVIELRRSFFQNLGYCPLHFGNQSHFSSEY